MRFPSAGPLGVRHAGRSACVLSGSSYLGRNRCRNTSKCFSSSDCVAARIQSRLLCAAGSIVACHTGTPRSSVQSSTLIFTLQPGFCGRRTESAAASTSRFSPGERNLLFTARLLHRLTMRRIRNSGEPLIVPVSLITCSKRACNARAINMQQLPFTVIG